MTAPNHFANPVAFTALKSVRPEDIRTHWDVCALTTATDAEWHPDLDAMQAVRAKRLAELPEIAAILGDAYDLFKRLQGASKHLRMLRGDLRACTDETSPQYRAIRVEKVAEQSRYRLDVCKRVLAVRREREALRGRGYIQQARAA